MIFSLARTVPGYQLLFRELFEVCTRKKHVRPLKTRAWNGSERENDEEEEGGGGERSGEAGCLKVPKRARKRDKGRAGIIDAGTRRDERERPGPEGPRGSKEDGEGPRLVFTRGTKTDAKPKAGACKKGQQVDGVSGLSG